MDAKDSIVEFLSDRIYILKSQITKKVVSPNALQTYMSTLSEDYWCAGWLVDLEYELWHEIITGPRFLRKEEVLHLAELAMMLDTWYEWNQPIGLVDWDAKYQKWLLSNPDHDKNTPWWK